MDLPSPTPEPGNTPSPAALAATEQPIQLRVALVSDERVPEGMVCMGTYRADRLVGRSVVPPEVWAEIEARRLLAGPVPVVLVAREAPPGVQCQLFALVPVPDGEGADRDDEPWAASVPAFEPDADASESDPDDDIAVMPIHLGNIVRYERDRVHPDSLPLEAADVLRKLIEGEASEVVDRALEDLFGV
jgi:hypothetical protein